MLVHRLKTTTFFFFLKTAAYSWVLHTPHPSIARRMKDNSGMFWAHHPRQISQVFPFLESWSACSERTSVGPNLQAILPLSDGKHLIRACHCELVSFASSDESLIWCILKWYQIGCLQNCLQQPYHLINKASLDGRSAMWIFKECGPWAVPYTLNSV